MKPRVKAGKILGTALFAIILYWILSLIGELFYAMKAGTAAQQLNGSDMEYGFSVFVTKIIGIAPVIIVLLCILWIWKKEIKKITKREKESKMKKTIIGSSIIFIMLIFFTACMAPPKIDISDEIKPNQTAFVVPLEGDMQDQAKLMTIDYLKKKQISARRVYLNQRKIKTGRFWYNRKWLPTEKVIKVDRTPVTMEWTAEPTSGTSKRNEGLEVESLDSVGFWVGGTITASILEDDAAAYQYYYAGKPLGEVLNQNVRGYILGILSEEFGIRPLSSEYKVDQYGRPVYQDNKKVVLVEGCKEAKSKIFGIAFQKSHNFFKQKGVTIESLGASQGLNYTDKEIQEAINKKFVAENDRQVADQELEAQRIRNTKKVEIATAEKMAAKEFAAAEDAAVKIRELEIAKIKAEAMLTAANKWKGEHGGIVPQGSTFLFGLDTKQ